MTKLESIYQFARDHNINIDHRALAGRLGLAIKDGDYIYVTLDTNRVKTSAQRTVILGHEVGHAKSGDFKSESEADKWAIKHLLPREELVNSINNCEGRVWEMAEELDVTEDFVVKAMKYYGLYDR